MAKDSIKEYGTDFLKQYQDQEKKEKTLRNKVIKKMKFLLDNSNDPYLHGLKKDRLDEHSTPMMIFIIMRVEQNYVNKTKQTEMNFNSKDK